jgi:hypothetical protein
MDASLPALSQRELVFVSHANPEDNAFCAWLTLRLTREGYHVWCDVANLDGGDDFWQDIEAAIRMRARKFIYVLSRHSNQKQGTLQELAVASGVARQLNYTAFIVPVKVDDLPYAEHNIQIHRLNALNFTSGWAEGLAALLQTLEDDGVPRHPQNGPQKVASWWNRNRLNHAILRDAPEYLWTNWFPIKSLPSHIWVSEFAGDVLIPDGLAYPTCGINRRLFSFASAQALALPRRCKSDRVRLDLGRDPPARTRPKQHELTTAVKQLLRVGWEHMAKQRGLPLFELSSARRTLWFPKAAGRDTNTVAFVGVDGKKSRRDLCGFRTMFRPNGGKYKRFWHYGLEAVPVLYPSPVLALKSHVLFTLDGKEIIGDAKAQHRARRSQCASWWNDKWRDLLLAAIARLTNDGVSIALPIAPSISLCMECQPLKYAAHISYDDADVRLPSLDLPSEGVPGDDDDIEDA